MNLINRNKLINISSTIDSIDINYEYIMQWTVETSQSNSAGINYSKSYA